MVRTIPKRCPRLQKKKVHVRSLTVRCSGLGGRGSNEGQEILFDVFCRWRSEGVVHPQAAERWR